VFRVLPAIIILLAVVVLFAPFEAAQAQSTDLFVVRGVPLDKTANTAQAARVQALADGQDKALAILLRRLTLSRDWVALPTPPANAVNAMVSAIQINNEKIAAGSYQADLTVEFEPSTVRNLLRRSGIAFSEAGYKPVLILPVYGAGGLVSYDYGANPLRDAWASLAGNAGLIPYKLAGVGGVPQVYFPADRAMTLDPGTIDRMKAATGTVAVIAVRVDQLGSPDSPRIRLSLRDYSQTLGTDDTSSEFLHAETGETSDMLITRAATMAATMLEDHWKSQTLARFDERNDLLVEVPLTSLTQWRDILGRLNGNILIDQVDIRSLASNRAQLLVHVLGPVSQLQLSLAQDDLDLEQVRDTPPPATGEARWQLRSGTRTGG
jgi:hypothetical protein